MAAQVPPPILPPPGQLPSVVRDIEDRIRELETRVAVLVAEKPNNWLTNLLQGVTLLSIVGFAFWFGTLSNKVEQATTKLDTLSTAVSSASKESISSRLTAVESKLETLDKKMDSIDSKLDAVRTQK